jgi:hypothetical protein
VPVSSSQFSMLHGIHPCELVVYCVKANPIKCKVIGKSVRLETLYNLYILVDIGEKMIRYSMPVPRIQTHHHPYSFTKLKSLYSGISAWLVICLLASLWLSSPTPVHAATITVACNPSDLRDAIIQANGNSEPDTLELAPNCRYTYFSGPYGENGQTDALPVISSEITVQGAGATIERSSQAGVAEFRILELDSGANLSLYDITIKGGSLTNPGGPSSGGGIYNGGGRLTLTNVNISNNRAGNAGGIRALDGSITTIISSVISSNLGTSANSTGGGIQNNGDLTISDTLIAANSANQGGGIDNKTNLIIKKSTLTGNSSVDGAGIKNDGGVMQISNSTIYANSATRYGGGIFSTASLTIINATIYKNSASIGGGIYILGAETAAVIKNSIIANSTGSNCHGNLDSSSSSNLLWPSTDPSCVGGYGDPKLNSLGNYGGPTPTLSLRTGSKAMDTGDDGICTSSPIDSVDQRGSPRPYGPQCDIGSFEGMIDVSYVYLPAISKQ